MPLDLQGTLYARIDALLSGYAPFAALMPPGKYRPMLATTRGYTGTRATLDDPAPFPRVTFDIGSDSHPSFRKAMPFSDTPASVNRAVPVRMNVDFRITHDKDTTLAQQTPLEAAVAQALESAGRTLGLGWVSDSTIEGINRGMEPLTRGTTALYPTSRFRLVVVGAPMRNTLIAV